MPSSFLPTIFVFQPCQAFDHRFGISIDIRFATAVLQSSDFLQNDAVSIFVNSEMSVDYPTDDQHNGRETKQYDCDADLRGPWLYGFGRIEPRDGQHYADQHHDDAGEQLPCEKLHAGECGRARAPGHYLIDISDIGENRPWKIPI